MLAAVLEQKVTGIEAHRIWRELLRLAGEPAPGPAPAGMRVVPSARRVLEVTDWEWHRCGLDGARRRALRAVASVAHRLEPDDDCDSVTLQRRMRTVPGIGIWTAAEVAQRALGCPDSVSYGDYHTKNLVGWSLAGRKTDDDGMMALLEPWRGHRQRVVRLLVDRRLDAAQARSADGPDGLPPLLSPAPSRATAGRPASCRRGCRPAPSGSPSPAACSCTIAAPTSAPRFSAAGTLQASVRCTSTTPSSSPP